MRLADRDGLRFKSHGLETANAGLNTAWKKARGLGADTSSCQSIKPVNSLPCMPQCQFLRSRPRPASLKKFRQLRPALVGMQVGCADINARCGANHSGTMCCKVSTGTHLRLLLLARCLRCHRPRSRPEIPRGPPALEGKAASHITTTALPEHDASRCSDSNLPVSETSGPLRTAQPEKRLPGPV